MGEIFGFSGMSTQHMEFYKKLLSGISLLIVFGALNEVLQEALGWNFVLGSFAALE